ncbi:MAG: cupin domain-containing protein [Solirubrobacterales bacterium]
MSYRVLRSTDSYWRRSNQMGVLNTDLSKQLGASDTMGARLWRIEPGQASTNHRHRVSVEIYLLLEGLGKIRIDDEVVEFEPMDSVLVAPESIRQPFNDTDADQLWLVFGAPPELANTLEMSEDDMTWIYPDGPKAMPPELS